MWAYRQAAGVCLFFCARAYGNWWWVGHRSQPLHSFLASLPSLCRSWNSWHAPPIWWGPLGWSRCQGNPGPQGGTPLSRALWCCVESSAPSTSLLSDWLGSSLVAKIAFLASQNRFAWCWSYPYFRQGCQVLGAQRVFRMGKGFLLWIWVFLLKISED